MLEDLYEFEKCYFINYFQVTPTYAQGGLTRRGRAAQENGAFPEVQAQPPEKVARLQLQLLEVLGVRRHPRPARQRVQHQKQHRLGALQPGALTRAFRASSA